VRSVIKLAPRFPPALIVKGAHVFLFRRVVISGSNQDQAACLIKNVNVIDSHLLCAGMTMGMAMRQMLPII
jgi:hypothetical protein